jgi:hypothetical protein
MYSDTGTSINVYTSVLMYKKCVGQWVPAHVWKCDIKQKVTKTKSWQV